MVLLNELQMFEPESMPHSPDETHRSPRCFSGELHFGRGEYVADNLGQRPAFTWQVRSSWPEDESRHSSQRSEPVGRQGDQQASGSRRRSSREFIIHSPSGCFMTILPRSSTSPGFNIGIGW